VQIVAAVHPPRQEHLFWSKLPNRNSTASVSTADWHWLSSNSARGDTPYLNGSLAANHPPLFASDFVSRTAGSFELLVELCSASSLFGLLRGLSLEPSLLEETLTKWFIRFVRVQRPTNERLAVSRHRIQSKATVHCWTAICWLSYDRSLTKVLLKGL